MEKNEFSVKALAISASIDILRVVWSLQQALDLNFKIEENCIPKPSMPNENYRVFAACDENEVVYRLIENHVENTKIALSKKFKQFDFFILISDNSFTPDLRNIKTKISKQTNIQGVFEIELCYRIIKALKYYSF